MIDTSIQRVEINQVIENQLPEFVQAESPLFVDFMKQYYISLKNIKVDQLTSPRILTDILSYKHMLVLRLQNIQDYRRIHNLFPPQSL